MMKRYSLIPVSILASLVLIVSACGGSDPTATPRPTAAPTATQPAQPTAQPAQPTAARPTATSAPAPRATATASPVPPSPTPTSGERIARGGSFLLPTLADIGNLDPSKAGYFFSFTIGANVYSSVLRYNWEPPLDKLLPDLAESWMAEAGGMKYTFRFRSDVQWHDGRPFTAEDAKFSLALQENRFTSDLSNIERMETPDPFTLVVDLKRAQASFPAYLAIYWEPIFAKHVHEGAGGDLTNGPTVGTGPFKLEEYRPGTSIKMVANPDYFIPEIPYVDSIEYFIISDAGTRQALILAGRLDIIGTAATDMDSEVADSLKGINSDIQLLAFDVGTVQVIVMNAEASPWDDVRVRRALFLAIDRWRVVDLLPHLAKPTGPLVGPPGWGLSDDELFELPGYRMGAELEEDQEEARRLLAEAGHADGIEADLISSPLPSAGQVREVLVADLAKFGFRLTGSQVSAAEDVARRLARDFELNIQGVGYTVPDPDGASIGVLPGLFTILEDARIAELFEMQSGEIDEARRRGLVVQLQERLLEVAAIVPLAWQKFVWAASPRVRGFHASLGRYTNVRYDRIWLDE